MKIPIPSRFCWEVPIVNGLCNAIYNLIWLNISRQSKQSQNSILISPIEPKQSSLPPFGSAIALQKWISRHFFFVPTIWHFFLHIIYFRFSSSFFRQIVRPTFLPIFFSDLCTYVSPPPPPPSDHPLRITDKSDIFNYCLLEQQTPQ